MADIISIGNKLQLKRIVERGDLKDSNQYTSQVLDEIGKDKYEIAMPILSGRIIPLDVGAKYHMLIFSVKGFYECKVLVLARGKKDNFYVLHIQVISSLEKNQRRQYYRLTCFLEMQYRILSNEEIMLKKEFRKNEFASQADKEKCFIAIQECKQAFIAATLLDISGGGAKMLTDFFMEEKMQIVLDIPNVVLVDSEHNEISAIIISRNAVEKAAGKYEYRMEFMDITPKDREEIIKFIFNEERRIRSREKGGNHE